MIYPLNIIFCLIIFNISQVKGTTQCFQPCPGGAPYYKGVPQGWAARYFGKRRLPTHTLDVTVKGKTNPNEGWTISKIKDTMEEETVLLKC